MSKNAERLREILDRLGNDSYPNQNYGALDALHDIQKLLLGEEEIIKVIMDEKKMWDSLQDYEKVALPTAGVRLYAQAIVKAQSEKLEVK